MFETSSTSCLLFSVDEHEIIETKFSSGIFGLSKGAFGHSTIAVRSGMEQFINYYLELSRNTLPAYLKLYFLFRMWTDLLKPIHNSISAIEITECFFTEIIKLYNLAKTGYVEIEQILQIES